MLPDDLLDKNNSSNVPSKHIRWIGDKRDQFVDSVESILTIDNLSNQLDTLDIANENFQTDLNELVESLNKVFLDSAIENFGNKPVKINRNSKHHQPWFNEQCRVKRNDFNQAKKKHNLFKTEESRYDLKIASKAYKTVMNKSYEEFQFKAENELRSMDQHDPRKLWNKFGKKTEEGRWKVEGRVKSISD
ncbi:unnamed protein product [Mytilus coruscus]|uniref:Uncharacterized protein n=1 Tax=Mytilus coruscus TaxID=42192 RepID=A0A6J8F3Z5_MYTCO|nr:unnamed protein product [Mytilus coruscus]